MRRLPGLKTSFFFTAFAVFFCFFMLPRIIDHQVKMSVAGEWKVPLDTGDRMHWKSAVIRDKGFFLAYRTAYKHMGEHLHTGVDIQNGQIGKPAELVYAAAPGKVYDVKIQGAGTRVTIAHLLFNGEVVYSSYIHITDVRVKPGMRVNASTIIGRTFNRRELEEYGAYYDHLHFQLHRKVFNPSDTILLKTREEVLSKFHDPEIFFENYPREGSLDWRKWLLERKISPREFFRLVF